MTRRGYPEEFTQDVADGSKNDSYAATIACTRSTESLFQRDRHVEDMEDHLEFLKQVRELAVRNLCCHQ